MDCIWREILDAQLERMYNEEFGDTSRAEGMSVEDCQAEEIMNQSSTLLDRHYQVGFTFPNDVPYCPDSLRTVEETI